MSFMNTMSSSALDTEDLENVHLVRMEDVQPSRDRIERALESQGSGTDEEEVYETCIIDEVAYQRDYAVEDDSDSNIGSMVSIESEDIPDDDSEDEELIVPEITDPPTVEVPIEIEQRVEIKQKPPDSWPTLEILPGGVIKNANETDSQPKTETKATREMMYACAKCSQTFKYLFCLVKHVKWHEDQQKILKVEKTGTLTSQEQELIFIKKERSEFDKTYKKQKVEVLARPRRKWRIHVPSLREKENSFSHKGKQTEITKEAKILVKILYG